MGTTFDDFEPTVASLDQWNVAEMLARQAQQRPDKEFLVEAEGLRRIFTYEEARTLAATVGARLRARGYKPQERLAIMMNNSVEYIFAWLGAAHAGVVEVPINNDFKGPLLEHVVNLTTPRGVVVDVTHARRFLDSRTSLPDGLEFFVVGDLAEDTIAEIRSVGWSAEAFSALQEPGLPDSELARTNVAARELGAILSTSGTTGPSKAVMMPHAQAHFFAEETVNLMRLTEDDRYMLALPLFHVNAQFCVVYPCLLVGATAVLFPRFSSTRFSERVHEFGITTVNFVGVMMGWVASQPEDPRDRRSTLRCVWSSPTVAELAPTLTERYGLEAITEVYGQTETSMVFMTPYGEPRPPGAVGKVVSDYYDVAIVDPETDIEVAVGEVGELVIRPKLPWIVNTGYWNMPEASAAIRRNLWLHTGDALKCDADGWFYLVDRIKDAIRRRGENISSFEVESMLQRHELISECAVVAVPSEYAGGEDEIKACVILAPGAEAPSVFEEIVEWCDAELPKFMVPRYWEAFEELPKTPSAKVRKSELRSAGINATTYDRRDSSASIAQH
ncbi:hypothetical protein GQ85_08230 [Rhodococcus rhodochrous]|nr:hypothetical protein GQ85_08230 [Rhodococcus rhodochrous]